MTESRPAPPRKPSPTPLGRLIAGLRRFLDHPWLGLLVSIALILSGCSEIKEDLWENLRSGHFKPHHGIILIGVVGLLKNVTELLAKLDHKLHGTAYPQHIGPETSRD